LTHTNQRHIFITGQEYGFPYSKGLMASRIMSTGLAPARAFRVAEVVEDRLHGSDSSGPVSPAQLDQLVLDVLREEVGDRYAASFAKWQTVRRRDVPLIVLVGGATGVGKSTIATMLASRLGVTRVVPTDAIREVMRSLFTEDLMPSLHASSYDTARLVRSPLPRSADPLIIGFRDQISAVAVGIDALISRAVAEGTDLIIEGAHVVPGFFDDRRFKGQALVIPRVVTVEDAEQHRSHFLSRSQQVRARPSERQLEFFESIRKLQRYIKSLALEHGVPVVASYNLDATLSHVTDLVVDRAFEAVPRKSRTPKSPNGGSKRGAK
jgi:2-phosphoglycerate kinase